MTSLSQSTGYILLISYGLFMFGLSYFYLQKSKTHTNFLVADRKVGFIKSGFSTAATGYGSALFIASQKAYQDCLFFGLLYQIFYAYVSLHTLLII